jgi:hypothetical protein
MPERTPPIVTAAYPDGKRYVVIVKAGSTARHFRFTNLNEARMLVARYPASPTLTNHLPAVPR